ncbi:conserved membrane hypothetical protein [metagenome]|uniref:Uncharacterized protein n=1 Tax=metagenome TaxID=256318 RepID=A0A2P2C5B5_9ZZZZ
MADEDVEYFKPTGGRFIGGAGLVAVVVIVALYLLNGLQSSELKFLAGLGCLALLIWVAVLRPRIGVSTDRLVLRGMFSTLTIRLASVEQLVLRQFLAVLVEDQRYTSPAAGRSLRQMRRTAGDERDPLNVYSDFIEDRIRSRVSEAKSLSRGEDALPPVRRAWAWPEITVLAVLALALVVTVVL